MVSPTMYVLSVGLLVVILATVTVNASYDYSGLCTKLCSSGRGGNVCRCSAVHFAGKRTAATSYVVDTSSQQARDLVSPVDAYLLRKGDGRTADRQTDRRWGMTEQDRSLLLQLLPHLQGLYGDSQQGYRNYQFDNPSARRRPQLQLASLLQDMDDEESRGLPRDGADLDLDTE